MDVMIVGADEELRQKLATTIPLLEGDRVVQASGMMSAIWYGKTRQPDLIVIDLWPLDCSCHRLAELLEHFCPGAALRFSDRNGKLLPVRTYREPGEAPATQETAGDSALLST